MPRIVVLWALLLCCVHARAQVSGRIAWVSEYRFRGISLSQEQPAVQLGLNFDAPNGWYVGAFASSVKLRPHGGPRAQWLVYGGYSRRLTNGLRWEAGAEYVAFAGDSHYDYPEVYVGLAGEHLTARFYYARHYFDDEASVYYLETNGSWALGSRARVFAHLGWSHRNGAETSPYEPKAERIDARVGVGMSWRRYDVQLAWVGTDSDNAYTYDQNAERNTWVLSVARNW